MMFSTVQTAQEEYEQAGIGQSMSKVVAIAGSAGACTAMREILSALPADFPSPILYLQHMNSSHLATLAGIFQYSTALKVRCARRDECLTEGVVYVCSPGSDCTIRRDNSNALAHTVSFRTIDHFLASVAAVYEQRLVAVLLSGGGSDGAAGIRVVHATHGTVLAQDESSAHAYDMPGAAAATGCVDLVLPSQYIGPLLVDLVRDGHSVGALQATSARLTRSKRTAVTPVLQNALGQTLSAALLAHRTNLGNIQLFNPSDGSLAIVAQRGFGLDFLDHFKTVTLQDESACGRAIRNRAPILIADVAADPRFAVHRRIAEVAGFRAVQSTPLIGTGGKLLGVLSTHFRSPHEFMTEEVRRLEQHIFLATKMIERLSH